MSKQNKQKPANTQNKPPCPICGRRSSVRLIGDRMHYCDHCREAFTA